jgi:hypothetical protein
MNKHAAEKIASEYYNLGIQLALQGPGLTKTAAGLGPLKFRNEVSTPLAALAAMLGGGGAGGYGAFKGLSSTPVFSKGMEALDSTRMTHMLNAIGAKSDDLANADALRELAGVGGGMALLGATNLGALAGGNLALKGARKVLNKNNPVERYLDLGVAQIPLGKARI